MHDFLTPTVSVASGVDRFNFTVSSGDIAKFFKKSQVRIHSPTYSHDSGDLTVQSISGLNIEVSGDMGFVPDSTSQIDLIGFADQGSPGAGFAYRWI
jgi:hypothetical protein